MSEGGFTLGGMMPLGSRVVPEDATLEGRIKARLNEALDANIAAEVFCHAAQRGLGSIEGDRVHSPIDVIRLSVDDVARIAAQEARAWF